MALVRLRTDVFVLASAEERDERGEKTRRIAERAIGVEVELEQVLAQEDHGFRAGQHPDVRREPELEGMLPDHPIAERVERRDLRIRVAIRDELVDPHR